MDNTDDVEKIAQAFRKILSEGEAEDAERRAILIKRIPIICNDIIEIKGDLKWVKWISMAIGGGIISLVITFLSR